MSGAFNDNKKIYDENWDQWSDLKEIGPASRWLRSLVYEHIKSIDAYEIDSILDLGCGQGCNTYYLAKWLPDSKVTGIDFSDTGIRVAKKLYDSPNLNFEIDLDSKTLSNSFDLVTCFEVLEHVDDWQELLQRIAASANKYVMLSFPVGRMRPFEVNVGHVRNFKIGEVEKFLIDNGFSPLSIFYAGFPFYNPLYREFCNITNAGSSVFTKGKFGFFQKIVSMSIYFLFRYLSTKRCFGDQFCGLFVRSSEF